MSEFETTMMKFREEAEELKKIECDLKIRAQLFNEKMMGFMKEHGLQDNFSLADLSLLSIRKSRT